jgi:hypothetical protein
MLVAQIPHETKRKIANELGIDIKIFKATRKSESEVEENRITKLEAVVKYIREWGNLGSIEEPDQYFEDTLDMRLMLVNGDTQIVYFTGQQQETIVGLGGSVVHMIGAAKITESIGASIASGIFNALEKELKKLKTSGKYDGFDGLVSVRNMQRYASEIGSDKFPLETFSFMAKRLLFSAKGENFEKNVAIILGSPLYVAKED